MDCINNYENEMKNDFIMKLINNYSYSFCVDTKTPKLAAGFIKYCVQSICIKLINDGFVSFQDMCEFLKKSTKYTTDNNKWWK